jgi:prefoldin subunit 5
MEKQRLEKELSRLEQRKKRIHERLGEVQRAMEKLDETAQREQTAQSSSVKSSRGKQAQADERQWKKLAVDY